MTTTQRDAALKQANIKRFAQAELRRDLRAGRVLMHDVLMNPPVEFEHFAIIDVVRIARDVPRYRCPLWLERMGRAAIRDGINLAMPIGRSSLRTRRWVAHYADWYRRGKGRQPEVAA